MSSPSNSATPSTIHEDCNQQSESRVTTSTIAARNHQTRSIPVTAQPSTQQWELPPTLKAQVIEGHKIFMDLTKEQNLLDDVRNPSAPPESSESSANEDGSTCMVELALNEECRALPPMRTEHIFSTIRAIDSPSAFPDTLARILLGEVKQRRESRIEVETMEEVPERKMRGAFIGKGYCGD